MKYSWLMLLLGGCSMIPGTDDYKVRQGQKIVLDSLVDPASAVFRDSKIVNGDTVCGAVNARNSFGGMSGFSYFAVKEGKAEIMLPDTVGSGGKSVDELMLTVRVAEACKPRQ